MKKLLLILVIGFAVLSCEKERISPLGLPQVCAECIELNSGAMPPDFCGTPQEVALYVRELKKIQGMNWSCVIK